MTAKLSESDSQPASVSVSVSATEDAAWTRLIQSSVPGLGFLFEVTGKPWTAWLGVLGLVFAATIAGLLGFGGGMQGTVENDCKYLQYFTIYKTENARPTCCFRHFASGSNGERFDMEWIAFHIIAHNLRCVFPRLSRHIVL